MKTLRIGCGAGYSGDRLDPAIELAEKGSLDYLVFECLAERTIALAQLCRLRNPESGFDPLLKERMRAVLPICQRNRTRIITNMGAANPEAAAHATVAVATELGLSGLKVASVLGDDVLSLIRIGRYPLNNVPDDSIVSANAYLGAGPIVEALGLGADVVITGRTSDPALFLAPMMHEFRWREDDWRTLGQGTVIGHLLECAGQITGGYFADPSSKKEVPNLARLGFPLAEIQHDGTAVVTKVSGSGGMLTRHTCLEQLLYEVQDPAAYITPDVVADFSTVVLEEDGPDRVRVSGAEGKNAPADFKVSIGYRNGFLSEGEISYAGSGALLCARLAQKILEERLAWIGFDEVECSFIGVNSIHGLALSPASPQEPYEVRLRIAARARSLADAQHVFREVEALYTNGPAGGGGATGSAREIIAMENLLLPRSLVRTQVRVETAP
jgi:Acyclic terpene utilisation family protein AtuA